MSLFDTVIRWIPGAIWWRFNVSLSLRRGDFENSWNHPMYADLIRRWAVRVGPLNLAALRLK